MPTTTPSFSSRGLLEFSLQSVIPSPHVTIITPRREGHKVHMEAAGMTMDAICLSSSHPLQPRHLHSLYISCFPSLQGLQPNIPFYARLCILMYVKNNELRIESHVERTEERQHQHKSKFHES